MYEEGRLYNSVLFGCGNHGRELELERHKTEGRILHRSLVTNSPIMYAEVYYLLSQDSPLLLPNQVV